MFRSNFLVRNGRYFLTNLGSKRSYCNKPLRTRLQDKYYIVEVTDKSKSLPRNFTLDKSSITEIPARVTKEHWLRILDALNDILRIYKNQLRIQLKKVGIHDKFINEKKVIAEEFITKVTEKTPVKLKEVSAVGQEQWIIMKESESFSKFKKLPTTIIQLSKDLGLKAHGYWLIFEKSPQKEKIVAVFQVCIASGKKGALEIYKFYKDVIKAPVPKIKH